MMQARTQLNPQRPSCADAHCISYATALRTYTAAHSVLTDLEARRARSPPNCDVERAHLAERHAGAAETAARAARFIDTLIRTRPDC
jgi:hypothetical protein